MKKFLEWLDGGSWAAAAVGGTVCAAMLMAPVAIWWFK